MKRRIIPYQPHLKELARKQRRKMTLGEKRLWAQLKGQRMHGFDFHRQKPLDCFIVDFYCHELNLAIEIDGCSHNESFDADSRRQTKLRSLGIRFLRFTEKEVATNLDGVLSVIDAWVEANPPRPSATPLKRGNKDQSSR
ncbi:MAG: endonuclease domain-containing protein [bacterium]